MPICRGRMKTTLNLDIWHYDADFDVIAAVTGQASAWVVPQGTMN